MDRESKSGVSGPKASHEAVPRLYSEFSSWFHLLTAPEDYAEEAELYGKTIMAASGSPPRTVLELGSGGGNNASHIKAKFKMSG